MSSVCWLPMFEPLKQAIVQAAGGAWQALDGQPVFPLEAGADYGKRSFPTLVVARSELLEVFGPLVHSNSKFKDCTCHPPAKVIAG